MNTTIICRSPVRGSDVNVLAELVYESGSIVSTEPDFRAGLWESFIEEYVRFDTVFYAHLDLNFTARIAEFSKDEPKNDLQRKTAATMCLAICAHMKVNPTFASNEYAFSGSFDPDERLAYFYFINNTHPQVLADLALGRIQSISCDDLPKTVHHGQQPKRTKLFGLVHLALLKLMELQTSDQFGSLLEPERGTARLMALQKWMYDDFLMVGSVLLFAHELWGRNSVKSIVASPNSRNAAKIFASVENATWDLLLAENWAQWEGRRNRNDPMNLIFTHDRALSRIACSLLGMPGSDDVDRQYLESLKIMWPEEIAEELLHLQRKYENSLDNPMRTYPKTSDKYAYYKQRENELTRAIQSNCSAPKPNN